MTTEDSKARLPRPNIDTLRIDISGGSAIGKSSVAYIIAKALEDAYADRIDEAGGPLEVVVVNSDGDWDHVVARAEREPLVTPAIKRVVIMDANAYGGFEMHPERLSARDIAALPVDANAAHLRTHGYVGPADFSFDRSERAPAD